MVRGVWLGLIFITTAVHAQPRADIDLSTDKLVTKETTVVCSSPFHLTDAAKAFAEEKWMKEIDCVWLKAKLPVTLIEPSSLFGVYQYGRGRAWRVRIKLPSGLAATVYVNPYELTLPDGREVPPHLR